jgi:urease accessory protein
VVARRGPRSVAAALGCEPPVGFRPLPPKGTLARVALVQTGATLVAGDRVRVEIVVAAGAAVEIVETAGTLAHPVPAGEPAIEQRIVLRVGSGGTLIWHGQPLVLAAATRLTREVRVDLDDGAAAAIHETVALGRAGERAGAAELRFRAEHGGQPLLDETLVTGDQQVLSSPAVLGHHRVLDSLSVLGHDAPGTSHSWMPLAGHGALRRWAAPDAGLFRQEIDAAFAAASTAVLARVGRLGGRPSSGSTAGSEPTLCSDSNAGQAGRGAEAGRGAGNVGVAAERPGDIAA